MVNLKLNFLFWRNRSADQTNAPVSSSETSPTLKYNGRVYTHKQYATAIPETSTEDFPVLKYNGRVYKFHQYAATASKAAPSLSSLKYNGKVYLPQQSSATEVGQSLKYSSIC